MLFQTHPPCPTVLLTNLPVLIVQNVNKPTWSLLTGADTRHCIVNFVDNAALSANSTQIADKIMNKECCGLIDRTVQHKVSYHFLTLSIAVTTLLMSSFALLRVSARIDRDNITLKFALCNQIARYAVCRK